MLKSHSALKVVTNSDLKKKENLKVGLQHDPAVVLLDMFTHRS